jgi:hypothetical protein
MLLVWGDIELIPVTVRPYPRERNEATTCVTPDKLFYINLQTRAKSTFLAGISARHRLVVLV